MRIGLGATRLWVTWSDNELAPEHGEPVDAELVDDRVVLVFGGASKHHVSRYQQANGEWIRRVDFMSKDAWMVRYPMFLVTGAAMVNVIDEYWDVHLPPVWQLQWPMVQSKCPMTADEIEHGIRKRFDSAKRHGVELRRVIDELPKYARGVLPNWNSIISDYR